MSDALEPWKRRGVKKGRIRNKLLEDGPAPVESILALAKLDDPSATRESLTGILEAAPHKFYKTSDGRWAAFVDEEIRTIYRPAYLGIHKKRKKSKDRGKLAGRESPDAPADGRFGEGEDGIPSVIIMGDELMMTGTPRLLIEFKADEERIRAALKTAHEEETPIRFFAKEGERTVFLGTRNVLDLVGGKSGLLRVIASPAADDARRAIAPSQEQLLLLQTRQDPSTLPVSLDGSVVMPYVRVPVLGEEGRRSLAIPAAPQQSDANAIRREFLQIRSLLAEDPTAWSQVLPFLERKKPLVDARTWEKLLLMAINAPNSRCLDLVEVLDLYLGEEPDPGFALHVVQAFSRSGDPEGKIATLMEEYADIAKASSSLDRQGALSLARAFSRGEDCFDEAARMYARVIEAGEGLPPDDLGLAAAAFLFSRDLGAEAVGGFLSCMRQALFDGPSALPDAPDRGFLDALGSYLELVERYRPSELLDTVSKILGYLTAVQEEKAACAYYDQYRAAVRKVPDLVNLLSCFETCESVTALEWTSERLYEAFAARREILPPPLLEVIADQLEIVEGMIGRESLYAADIREWIARKTAHPEVAPKESQPLLKEQGIRSVAIFGGNDIYRERMKGLLIALGATRVIPIPPSFESRLDQAGLKEKLRGADLVLHVATYTKHADHYMLQNLKSSPDVGGIKVIRVNGGPSRGIHELKTALAS